MTIFLSSILGTIVLASHLTNLARRVTILKIKVSRKADKNETAQALVDCER